MVYAVHLSTVSTTVGMAGNPQKIDRAWLPVGQRFDR